MAIQAHGFEAEDHEEPHHNMLGPRVAIFDRNNSMARIYINGENCGRQRERSNLSLLPCHHPKRLPMNWFAANSVSIEYRWNCNDEHRNANHSKGKGDSGLANLKICGA
jgi:hypothetical protein